MGMVGIRGDVFVVAPASSFHHNNQSHHHQPHDHSLHHSDTMNNSNTALGVGLGIIPLLSSGNIGIDDGDELNLNSNRSRAGGGGGGGGGGSGGGIQLWQNQQSHNQSSYLKKPMLFDQNNSMNLLNVGGSGGNSATTSTTTCQDCGNQAKKDCTHRRCRTCCKSRGYDCATHIKSTWVPAARRRERQLSSTPVAASSGSTSGVKKPRLLNSQTTTSHTSTSNTTPPRSFDTSSSHQGASFRDALPGQIRAPAVFKCVRVTAIEDGDDEYAYQAVVKIGGHVFKGFLYDQGIEGREGFPDISELHLGGASGNGGRNGASSSNPIIDPSDVYGVSGGALLGDVKAFQGY